MPREDLPENFQPHRSFYGKVACFVNGIDPYPVELRRNNTLPIVQNPLNRDNMSLSQIVPMNNPAQSVL